MITNGCDTHIFHPANRDEARADLQLDPQAELILYVGNLLHTKGLRELAEAAAALFHERPRLQLILVGEGPLREELAAVAGQPHCQGRLLLPGPAEAPKVARWMAACDVFTLPSYAEGCPNVVLEALSSGRPVVGTSVGAIPDLITPDCGVLIPPKDPLELTKALRQALDTPWNQERIAQLRQRSWDDVGRETLEVIQLALR